MATSEQALGRLGSTRGALAGWNVEPWPVVRAWVAGAALVTVAMLGAVFLIASLATADPTPIRLPGLNTPATWGAVGHVLARNSLVLALHSFACLAGFIAGSSLPAEAARYRGAVRWVHEHAGPAAIAFVGCATAFSLFTQTYTLGHAASTLAAQGHMPPAMLLIGILPHAVPELVALFLPLAAWIIASRRGQWNQLLAATLVTTLIAIPVLVIAALVEVFVSPHLIILLRG